MVADHRMMENVHHTCMTNKNSVDAKSDESDDESVASSNSVTQEEQGLSYFFVRRLSPWAKSHLTELGLC